MVHEYLQVFEDLFTARIPGAIAAVRMLAFAKPRVGHRHDLALQQGIGFLRERIAGSGGGVRG